MGDGKRSMQCVWILIASVVMLGTAAGTFVLPALLREQLRSMYGYCLTVSFGTMPDSDAALEQWLGAQAGVSGVVSIRRDRDELTIEFQMIQSADGDPSIPDIASQASLLSYRDVIVPLRDCIDRGFDG